MRGAPHIRYSGAPFVYSFDAVDHQPSVTVVDLDGAGQSSIETVPLPRQRGLRIIEGSLDDVLTRGRLDPAADEYVLVRISDDRAILDLGARLREVYPNYVHAERTARAERAQIDRASVRRSRRDELSLCTDFIQDVTGVAATSDERELVQEILSDLQLARAE
ncbi:MAG: exonuclease SbcCD subunit D C-terminal domain-containing protein [Gammaproteobacteria bacterium]